MFQAPKEADWSNGLSAMEEALVMEKKANTKILDMLRVANDEDDPHVSCLIIKSPQYSIQ